MAEVGSAFVSVLPSARGFGSKLESEVSGEVGNTGKSVGGKFGNAFKVGALAVLGGVALTANFLKGAVDDAREAQVITARTENVLKTMGLTARVSATDIADLAGAISDKTGVDDEAIQSGQNLLLTFKNVAASAGEAGGVFEQTSGLMVDLSAAMGTDAQGAAIQLGKALNDPIKGVSALTRVGVSFSEAQKAQIQGFVETGNLARAQGVILGELENQFGGAAEAMATPADRASVAYGNLKEQIGAALLPVVDRLLNAFLDATPAISRAISAIGPAIAQVSAFFAPLIAQVGAAFGGDGGGLSSGLTSFATTVTTLVLPVVQQFAAAFTTQILPALQSLGQAIVTNVTPVVQTMAATFTGVVLPALTSLYSYLIANVVPVFVAVVGVIRDEVLPIASSLAQFFIGTLIPAVISIAQAVGAKLRPIFDQLVATFRADVLPTLQLLLAKFKEYQPTIEKVISVVVKVIGKLLEFAAAVLGTVLPPAIRFAGFMLRNVVPAVAGVIGILGTIIGKLSDFGRAILDRINDAARFLSGIKDKFGEALSFIAGIPGRTVKALGDLGNILYSAGVDLIAGFIAGIIAKAGDIVAAIQTYVTDKIPGFVKDALGIASPSKVFREIGEFTMDGLIQGIQGRSEKAVDAAGESAQKIVDKFRDKLEGMRDATKSVIDSLASEFANLRDGIANTFAGNLFDVSAMEAVLPEIVKPEAFDSWSEQTQKWWMEQAELRQQAMATPATDAAGSFINNLLGKRSELKGFMAAFKTLVQRGLDPAFLSQLISSGNGPLLLDLASGSRAQARRAESLFGQVGSLSQRFGSAVAENDPNYAELLKQTNRLERIEKALDKLPKNIGKELNGAVRAGSRAAA